MEQSQAETILKNSKKSCFLTGKAGTGKTFLANKLLDEKAFGETVAVTAPTGIAARNLKGQTLHSWLGIGLGRKWDEKRQRREPFDWFLARIRNFPNFNKLGIQGVETLVLDEVSMLDKNLLADVERIFRVIRENNRVFGGCRVVFLGDFLQLPPVSKAMMTPWAFHAQCWEALHLESLHLQKSYRQSDPIWLDILNEARIGSLSDNSMNLLESRVYTDSLENFDGTLLYTHNVDVDAHNLQKLHELPGKQMDFMYTWDGNYGDCCDLMKSLLAPEVLSLKIGAKVLITVNDSEQRFFNGSLGKVVAFDPVREKIQVELHENGMLVWLEKYKWDDDHRNVVDSSEVKSKKKKEINKVWQYPLKLAWAISIHKSQGMTLEKAYIEPSKCFSPGQFYTAVSRVKSLDGLFLAEFERRNCFADYDALEFYKALLSSEDVDKLS